jgi:hypothetical protein
MPNLISSKKSLNESDSIRVLQCMRSGTKEAGSLSMTGVDCLIRLRLEK